MRDYQTTYTFTCDRCARKAVFHSENQEEMREYMAWKNIGTDSLLWFFERGGGISVDLCPDCIAAFKKEFMEWLPPAFKKALGE